MADRTLYNGAVEVAGKLTTKVRNEGFGTAVAAAGSSQGDATAIAIDGGIIEITGGDNTKGVILPAVSGLVVGDRVKLVNASANTLEVYPATGDRVFPAADNAGITVASYGFLELFVYSVSASAGEGGWVGSEGVIGA